MVQSSEAAAAAAPSGGAVEVLQCPICMEELDDGGGVTLLPSCSHAFHSGCIGEWFRRAPAPTCPSCRLDMTKQHDYMKTLGLGAIDWIQRWRSPEASASAAALFLRRRRQKNLALCCGVLCLICVCLI